MSERAPRSPAPPAAPRRLARRTLLAGLVGLVLAAGTATAVQAEGASTRYHRYDAVYHEPTGSYFQLIRDSRQKRQGLTWGEATRKAANTVYKGRHGRLAVVDDPSVHKLLVEAYPARASMWFGGRAWIGLRYWCGSRSLIWVTREQQPSRGFGPWASPWHRSQINCDNRIPYMGVFYQSNNLWQAAGPLKRFPYYFVEFPKPDAAPGS